MINTLVRAKLSLDVDEARDGEDEEYCENSNSRDKPGLLEKSVNIGYGQVSSMIRNQDWLVIHQSGLHGKTDTFTKWPHSSSKRIKLL